MRLTTTDAAFLYTESVSGPMHISSVYVLEGELAREKLLAHFAARMHLLPYFRRKVAHVPFNLAHPEWVDDPSFDLGNHVVEHRLPAGTSLEAAVDVAIELNEAMLDRSKPLWKFYLISGVPNRTVVLQMTHHALIDGASGIELTTIIYDFDPKGANTPPPPKEPWAPAPPPGPVERWNNALRENLAKLREVKPFDLARGLTAQQPMLRRAMSVAARFFTRPVILAPFNAGMVGPKRKLRWLDVPMLELRDIRRALGGTINDVVLTVVTESVSRYLKIHDEQVEGQYLRIMCPVNVRTEDQRGALGNQVSAIFPVLPAWPMNATTRHGAVCAEMERIKEDQEAAAITTAQNALPEPWPVALAATQLIGTSWDPTALAARVQAPLVPTVGGFRPPNFGLNFVCTNVPGVQVAQYLCSHKVLDTYGVLVLTGNIGFSVTILSYNQRLYFNFICEPRLLPDIENIVEGARAAYDELLAEARKRTALARQG